MLEPREQLWAAGEPLRTLDLQPKQALMAQQVDLFSEQRGFK